MNKLINFICLSFLFFSIIIQAVVKGSETLVSVEQSPTFPAADSDNKMLGFGWFKHGFSLEDGSTRCIFDSVYPVSGPVNLNGGTLELKQDLLFNNVTNLEGLGTIIGNNYLFDLCSSITELPSDTKSFEDTTLFFNHDIVITSTIIFKGNCLISGNGNTLILAESGEVVIDTDACLEFRDLQLEGVRGNNIHCTDDSGKISLNDVRWIQDADFTFTLGSILFQDPILFLGDATFIYESSQTSTIESQTTLYVSEGMHLCLGKHKSTNNNPLFFTDTTSVLKFDDSGLIVPSTGLQLTKGKLIFDRNVSVDIKSTSTVNGLEIGDGTAENDFTLYFSSGAAVTHSGHGVYNNTLPNLFQASSKDSRFIRKENSNVYAHTDLDLPAMTIEVTSPLVPPFMVAHGKTLSFANASIVLPQVEFDITGEQTDIMTYNLSGDDSLFFAKGSLPLNLEVSGANNVIRGNGNLTGTITLQNADAQVLCELTGFIDNFVTLNEGTFTLNDDLVFHSDDNLVGPGKVELASNLLDLRGGGMTWTTPISWDSDGGMIGIHGKLTLKSTWTINGSVTLKGNDNKLVLDEGGEIVIADGGKLVIKDLRVIGIKDENIRCLTDTGTITLLKSDLLLEDDFTFAKGSMKFFLWNSIGGAHTFNYDSLQTSTIRKDAQLKLIEELTLSIGRNDEQKENEPLYFEDDTGQLIFDNTTFSIKPSGMRLTKGNVVVENELTVDIHSTSTSFGLFLGDGTTDGDMLMKLNPGSVTDFKKGHLVYNMTHPNGIVSKSKTARVKRGALFSGHYMSDFTFGNLSLEINPPAMLTLDPNVTVRMEDLKVTLLLGEVTLTGKRTEALELALDGNDSIAVDKGVLLAPISVNGMGNVLSGEGNTTQPIILKDSNAQLVANFNGTLLADIYFAGGTVVMQSDLNLANSVKFVGPGTISMGGYNVNFGQTDMVWPTDMLWNGTGGAINFQSKLSLSSTWTINGTVEINGKNNVFDFTKYGNVVINPASTLIFNNVSIENLAETNLRCLADDSHIVFNSCKLTLSDDYTLSKGSICFEGNTYILEPHSFIYDSNQTATIAKFANLRFKNHVDFYLGKKDTPGAVEPLFFVDETSILTMDSANWFVNQAGYTMKKGRVVCKDRVEIDIASTSTANGFTMGDGTAENDIIFEFRPGCLVTFKQGHMTANLTSPHAFMSHSKSSVFERKLGSTFYLKNNTLLSNISLGADYGTVFLIDEEKVFSYNDGRILLPGGVVDITGVRNDDFSNILAGNNSINVINGELPLYILISGINNTIEGNGTITGQIIYLSSAGEMNWVLNGVLANIVALNGGKMTLSRDLNCSGSGGIIGPGVVNIQGQTIKISPESTIMNTNINWQGVNGKISLQNNMTLLSTWTIDGQVVLDGNGHTLSFSEGGEIVITQGSTFKCQDIRLDQIDKQDIKCLGDDSLLILEDVLWQQSGNYTFDTGRILFSKIVDLSGTYTFMYDSDQTSTVEQLADLSIKNGLLFCIGKKQVETAVEPITLEDKTSRLIVDNARWGVHGNGTRLTNGRVVCVNDVEVDIASTTTNQGLILGNKTEAGDLIFEFRPGASVRFPRGHVVCDMYANDNVKSQSKTAQLIRNVANEFHVNNNVLLQNLTILTEPGAPLVIEAGKAFSYDNCKFIVPGGVYDLNGMFYSGVVNLLNGNDSILLSRGVLPLYTVINGTGNSIEGNGTVTGAITYLSPAAQLSWSLNGVLANTLTLNGGTFFLNSDLQVANGVTFIGPGTFDLGSARLRFGAQDLMWTSPIKFNGLSGKIDLNANLTLKSTWTISGDCTINGNGHILDLNNVGNLVVDDGATLCLRNIMLDGIDGINIRCLNEASVIALDNVEWRQYGHIYKFTNGSLKFYNKVKMTGDSVFAYETKQTSTIFGDAHLQFDTNFTFSYAPVETQSKDLLEFEKSSAQLKLKDASLYVGPSGLNLKKGELLVSGKSTIQTQQETLDDVIITDEGLALGDGVIVENDCSIFIDIGSSLVLSHGSITYNNLAIDSFTLLHRLAAIKIKPGTILNVNQTLNLGDGQLFASEGAQINVATSKEIIGSVFMTE